MGKTNMQVRYYKSSHSFHLVFIYLLLSVSGLTHAAEEKESVSVNNIESVVVNNPELVAASNTETVAKNNSQESLLRQLATAKLSKIGAIVDALDAKSGESSRPVFEALMNGVLYYDKKSYQLQSVVKTSDKKLIATDILTGAVIGERSKKEIKKVRTNNKLRGQLRGVLARLDLSADDPQQRLSAVKNMLDNLTKDNVEVIRSFHRQEQEESVVELMSVILAMDLLANSKDGKERLAAIELLSQRLEAPVRNQLVALAENESETDTQVKSATIKAVKGIEARLTRLGYVEQLFFGLSLGSVLLLAAIGLAITFGVMGVINMAHGEMIMIGAYTTYVVQLLMPELIEYSIFVAIPAAFLTAGFVGIIIERFVIRYLHGRPLETLLATFGISLILQQAVRTIFSPLNREVITPVWMSGSLEINAALSLTYSRIYILIFALIVFAVLQLILKKTSLGLNVRAVSQNRNMAKSMGIRTDRVDAMTFGLGSGIAGVAGVALSQLTNVGPNLGQAYIIDSFMVVVFGGVGNLLGTLFAGFSLGIANKFLEPATGAVLANIVVLVFIILFIQKRPKGLFPQKGRAAE